MFLLRLCVWDCVTVAWQWLSCGWILKCSPFLQRMKTHCRPSGQRRCGFELFHWRSLSTWQKPQQIRRIITKQAAWALNVPQLTLGQWTRKLHECVFITTLLVLRALKTNLLKIPGGVTCRWGRSPFRSEDRNTCNTHFKQYQSIPRRAVPLMQQGTFPTLHQSVFDDKYLPQLTMFNSLPNSSSCARLGHDQCHSALWLRGLPQSL